MSGPLAASLSVTPLLRRAGAGSHRVLEVTVDGAEGPARLVLRASGAERVHDLGTLGPASSTHRVAMPAARGRLGWSLRVGDAAVGGELEIPAVRPWRVSLVHFSHHDIGYTDLPSVCLRLQLEYLDRVLEYCGETSGFPRDSRFRWTLDTSWPLAPWLASRGRRAGRRLAALAREGRIEVTALFAAFNAGLPDYEELVRSIAFACGLRRSLGIPVVGAMSTDVPGHPWALASLLAGSGICYLMTSVNALYEQKGLFRAREPEVTRPFYWRGPDGAEVLVWNTAPGANYGSEGRDLGFYDDLGAVERSLPRALDALEASGWPYDLVSYRVGTDNRAPDLGLARLVKSWNERYAAPALVMDTASRFLAELERRESTRFAHVAGDWTDWWLDGPASSAYETGVARAARERLLAAGSLAALARLAGAGHRGARGHDGPGAAGLAAAYDRLMLYDEHTWGMWDTIFAPTSPDTRHHWLQKALHAYEAERASRDLAAEGAGSLSACLARREKTGGGAGPRACASIVLFNPFSHTRSEPVMATVEDRLLGAGLDTDPGLGLGAGAFRLVDRANGREVPIQRWSRTECWSWKRETTIAFIAREVPGFGWRIYDLERADGAALPGSGEPAVPAVVASPDGLQNGRLALRFCRRTGAIGGLRDLTMDVELIDPGAGCGLGGYVYDRGEPPAASRSAAEFDCLEPPETGPVFGRLASGARHASATRIRTEAALWAGLARVDISLEVDKIETLEKEGVYVAFPLAVPQASFLLDVAGTSMRPGHDQVPGSCTDWHAAQRWLDVSGPDFGVCWAAREANVVSLGGIRTGRLSQRFDPETSGFFAYVMNNAWDTNFKESQGGSFSFRFSLASHPCPVDPVRAHEFGTAVCSPMDARAVAPSDAGFAAMGSLLEVGGSGAIAASMKPAEDHRGVIVRLRELAGSRAVVDLVPKGWTLAAAWEASPVEEDRRRLEVSGGARVEIAARATVSVRLVPGG